MDLMVVEYSVKHNFVRITFAVVNAGFCKFLLELVAQEHGAIFFVRYVGKDHGGLKQRLDRIFFGFADVPADALVNVFDGWHFYLSKVKKIF